MCQANFFEFLLLSKQQTRKETEDFRPTAKSLVVFLTSKYVVTEKHISKKHRGNNKAVDEYKTISLLIYFINPNIIIHFHEAVSLKVL